jgi:hypothetical protein
MRERYKNPENCKLPDAAVKAAKEFWKSEAGYRLRCANAKNSR